MLKAKSTQKTIISGFIFAVIGLTAVSFILAREAISQTVSGSCAGAPPVATIGQTVIWTVEPSGASGQVSYQWSGDEALTGNSQSVSKVYSTAGIKSARVLITHVTSGGDIENLSLQCIVSVLDSVPAAASASATSAPNVILLKKPPVQGGSASIYLSQIPYTGFGDTSKIGFFLLVLALWSASAVYFFRSKLWSAKPHALKQAGVSSSDGTQAGSSRGEVALSSEDSTFLNDWLAGSTNINNSIMQTQSSSAALSSVLPKQGGVNAMQRSGIIDIIAAEAERNRTVISEEGMKLIAERGNHDAAKVLNLVGQVIHNAEEKFERDDGWLLLNKEKIVAAISHRGGDTRPHETTRTETNAGHHVTHEKEQPRQQHSGFANVHQASEQHHARTINTGVDTSLFVTWLATGNRDEAAKFLKTLRDSQGSAEPFLRKVILDLDIVYRARFDDVEGADDRLMHTVSGLSNDALEQLIAVLFSVLEQRYKSSTIGLKIALLRMTEAARRR